MSLPTRPYNFYCGIDPGFSGAIGLINNAGTSVKCWDMPVTTGRKGRDRDREISLPELRDCFNYLRRLPDCAIGIEWPTTRPGEGANRSERFGRGKGYLEAFAFLMKFDYFKIVPNLWKGRLGLPGKDHVNANQICCEHLLRCYPSAGALVRGPRGGVLDGRTDALLLAHFLRGTSRDLNGICTTHGKGSTELLAAMYGGTKKPKRGRLPTL